MAPINSVHTNQYVAECAGLIAIYFPSLQGVTGNFPYKILPFSARCLTYSSQLTILIKRMTSGYSN
ncbi:hypothetical protein VT06_09100 [Arsukibacterium sp. MJ3]|nr:hypothetical protein VT06_09100 [Arsukibacterium sp. MJ3]